MQQDIAAHYAATRPGEVQVLGVDLWNGTAAQVNAFRNTTGATYPLLLNGASFTGGAVDQLYGPYDNYIVLNKQRIVRYHAARQWPHGNRYHLNEIRACVDTLVSALVDVPPSPSPLRLSVSPNPAHGTSVLALTLPTHVAEATVEIYDLAGRVVATPWHGPLAAGPHEWSWDGRGSDGGRLPAGVYLVRARLGATTRTLRLVLAR